MKTKFTFSIIRYFYSLLLISLVMSFLASCHSSVSEESSLTESSAVSESSLSKVPTALPGVEPDFDGTVISIGVYYDSATANTQSFEQQWNELTQEINPLLASAGKDYRLSFEMVPMDYESFDQYENYHIMLNMPYYLPEVFIEENFLDLTQALHSGLLKPVYESQTESYWKATEQNGKIYNPMTGTSAVAESL